MRLHLGLARLSGSTAASSGVADQEMDGMERFTAQVRAPAGLPRDGGARPRRRGSTAKTRPEWMVLAGPAVTLAMMVWGIDARPYWGDEPDTVSAVSRTVPQLIRLLGHIDAVHGLYYLLLWPMVRVAGTSEFATRLPSALAMAAAAGGVAVIARRLAGRRAGLWAGLMFAVLPRVSVEGQYARPYSMVTAAAVLASYLLVRVVRDPRPRWLAGYGLSLVLVGYLQLFGLLLVAAHAVALYGLGRRDRAGGISQRALVRRWLVTLAAVGVAMAPLVAVGWAERWAISWIQRPGWHDVAGLITTMAAGSVASAVVIGLLGVVGGSGGGWPARAWPAVTVPAGESRATETGGGLGWLAVPWLVLPPAVLLTVSQIKPLYVGTYVTYCLPAVALLAGAGLAALRWPLGAAALALVAALAAPAQLRQRQPGGGMLAAGQLLSTHERPGDAIVYPGPTIPPWDVAYPEGFAPLRDLSLRQTAAASDRLWATAVPPPVLARRELSARRLWVVQDGPDAIPARYIDSGFRLTQMWKLRDHVTVWLYTKGS